MNQRTGHQLEDHGAEDATSTATSPGMPCPPPPPPLLPCPALPLAKARDCKGEDIVGRLLYWLYWLECCSEAQGNKDDQYEGVVRVPEAAVALPARVFVKRVRA